MDWTTMHFHSEVKINGTWHHNSEHKIDLNNPLFAKMANVENTNPDFYEIPIAMPKGIPKDVTLLTELHWNKHKKHYATHSASWLNAHEINDLHQWIHANAEQPELTNWYWFENETAHRWIRLHFPMFMGITFDAFVESLKTVENSDSLWQRYNVDDVRYVFWFESIGVNGLQYV